MIKLENPNCVNIPAPKVEFSGAVGHIFNDNGMRNWCQAFGLPTSSMGVYYSIENSWHIDKGFTQSERRISYD